MAFVWNNYYSITKRILLLSGQWPYQEKRTKLFRVSSVTLIIVSLIVPQIKSLTDRVCDDWEKLNSAEEYEIMKKYATNAKLITLAYFLYIFLCFSICMLISFMPTLLNIVLPLNESRPASMPYDAYYFVDKEKYYFYIMFHITVSGIIALMVSLAHDCTLFIYIEHVCSLFAVAGFRLETLSCNNLNDTVNNRPNDRVALQYGDINETLKYLTYIFGQILHTFCFSLQGQRLINHSMQLHDKIIMAFVWKDYYSITKRLLSFSGQWPYQEKRTRLFRVSTVTLVTLSQIVPQIKSLTDRLCDDWEKLNSTQEYEIMKKYATNARLISFTYFFYVFSCFSGFLLSSFTPKLLDIVLPLNESRSITMPYDVYYFVDEEKYFFYIMFHICVCGTISVTAAIAHDCTFFIYIEHVCSLFAVAGFRLETLLRKDRNNAINLSDNRKIVVSIHAHWRALR
ncbi:hypothetical protein ALC60_09847 [Trachymyrmex zeteki]|uniref:Odorant receptor n=1 Tax=Mycetomoellerius zeteki TaxID=64791 RepID=A0A151WT45_9HYME|nr:hypothetical protein ALC60_09847 [Trachymyrmex zeteki]